MENERQTRGAARRRGAREADEADEADEKVNAAFRDRE
jgi:hypothetical protein